MVKCMVCIVHMWHGIDMQGHIALHMHGDIAFPRCGCMVEINHLIQQSGTIEQNGENLCWEIARRDRYSLR